MNRHAFIDSGKISPRCDVCYHRNGQCICVRPYFKASRLVNGEMETEVGEYPPGAVWGNDTIATSNTFAAVSGRNNYVLGPPVFVGTIRPVEPMRYVDGWPQMAVHATATSAIPLT